MIRKAKDNRTRMDFQALVTIALFTLGSAGVYGNDGKLSTTTGDTVLIPCDFGQGRVRKLDWYYNDRTGPVKILTLFRGYLYVNLSIDDAYDNRASLHDDSSTLILTNIVVKDEGTYRCDVEREGQTAVPNINTELHVFSITSETLPEIAQCAAFAAKSSVCKLYSNKSITMNCALSKVYPAKDVELIWYRDEQRVHSTDNLKENDDGTFNITAEIKVSESGKLTCNATFLTAQGAESTALPVAVWITHVPEAPNTPGKGLSKGSIAGIAVGLVVFVVACPVIIIISLRNRKGNSGASGGQQDPQVTITDETGNNGGSGGQQDSSVAITIETGNNGGSGSQQDSLDTNTDETDPLLPGRTPGIHSASGQDGVRYRMSSTVKKDFDEMLKNIAKELYLKSDFDDLGKSLGFGAAEIGRYYAENEKQGGTYMGTLDMLRNWRKRQCPAQEREALRAALRNAGFKRLAFRHLGTPAHDDFADILREVARKVRKNSEIDTLGQKLGFQPEDIQRYIANNHKTHQITTDGTLQMLRDWRKRQKESTVRSALKNALEQAEQIRLADDLFP